MSEVEVVKLIAQQGPWAVIFVVLLFYVMRQAAKREELLMAFQREVGGALSKVAARLEIICADIDDIKQTLHGPSPAAAPVESPRVERGFGP